MLKKIIIIFSILAIDLLLFKGPMMSGLLIILGILKLVVSLINRKLEKQVIIFLIIAIILNIGIISIGEILNDKVQKRALILYKDIQNKKNKDTIYSYNIYGIYVKIYEENKSKYIMKARMYNFSNFIYRDNEWLKIEND